MSDSKFKIDFGFFGGAFWITIFLAILKLSGSVDISIWWVLAPIFIALGLLLLVGMVMFGICIYYVLQGFEEGFKEIEDKEDEEEEEVEE